MDRKDKIYGGIIGIIFGSLILYILIEIVGTIIGFVLYFVIFYSGERYFKNKDKVMYYSSYYGIKYGWVIVLIGIVLVFLFSLGIFSGS